MSIITTDDLTLNDQPPDVFLVGGYDGYMTDSMNLNVRVDGELCDHVQSRLSAEGSVYENVSEYVRDLIRKDREVLQERAFNRVKAELQLAFKAPDSEYSDLSADDIINQNSSS